ncbi:MAG: hypothetical protein LBU39_01610 [Desulfobulbaceae bacterium]|jgi:hypothetical protein|nr:hypothetical protein [Desulfobulbaceae bacterium]
MISLLFSRKNHRAAHFLSALASLPLLLAACAAPALDVDENILLSTGDCAIGQTVFPQGNWQFVHEIVFRSESGAAGRFIGVVSRQNGELRCALTTLEGLTIFAARAWPGQAARVERALPPLDKPSFAAGLLADLRLLFNQPDGAPRCGWRAGERVYRWRDHNVITDVSVGQDNCWTIRAYLNGRQTREARAEDCATADRISPGRISLQATTDAAAYQLDMRLISAKGIYISFRY